MKLYRGIPEVTMESLTDGKIRQMLVNGGEWWLANQDMLSALKYSGYDVKHVWGTGGHNSKHAGRSGLNERRARRQDCSVRRDRRSKLIEHRVRRHVHSKRRDSRSRLVVGLIDACAILSMIRVFTVLCQ